MIIIDDANKRDSI